MNAAQQTDLPPALRAVQAVVGCAQARLLWQARLDAAGRGFLCGAAAAALAMGLARAAGTGGGWPWALPLLAVAGAAVFTLARRGGLPDAYQLAKRIDEQLGLKDRLASGYDLLQQARSGAELAPTPFTALVLADVAAAADAARRAPPAPLRIPRGVPLGGLCLALGVGASLLVGPHQTGAGGGGAAARQQARAFNQSLAKLAETIQAMEGLDDTQQKAMLESLRAIQISEEDLKKMSRADVIRRLKEANAAIQVPDGAQGTALKRAVEDRLRAVAEMAQVQQQLAEIEAINQRQAAIDLGNGQKAEAANVTLESSDLQIDQAIARAAARPGEAEQEYQKRLAGSEARAKAEREAIKKFLARPAGGADSPATAADAQKLAAMMASDAEFQGKVMEAIKDPTGQKLQAMREIYLRQLEREFEKESIPRGLRQQLNTYLGPAAPRAASRRGQE